MSPSNGASPTTGRMVSAVILGIIAIAFLTVGIVFCLVPAGSLPGWLGHTLIKVNGRYVPSPGHQPLRLAFSLIAGVVFAIGAWFSLRYRGPETSAPTGAEEIPEAKVTPAP